MAINYTTLFTKLGKLIKKYNSLTTLGGTTLPADLQEIVAAYGTALTGVTTAQSAIEGLHAQYVGLMNTVTGMRTTIASYADATLIDYDTVVSQLAGSDFSADTVLFLLITDMVDNAQTVERSIITLGTVTANARNVGNGTVLIDKVLDGYNSPLDGGMSHPEYVGRDSELHPASVTHLFKCASDDYGSRNAGRGSTFAWEDNLDFGEASGFPEGIGSGPGLAVMSQTSLTNNGDFESFSGTGADQTISSWDVEAGTMGTHISIDESVPYSGDGCLKFTGDGTVRPLLSQEISVNPLRRYCCTFRARLTGAGDASQLSIYLAGTKADGTPYSTATGPGSYTAALTSFTGSWTLYSFYFNAPVDTPNDLALYAGFDPGSAAPGAGVGILIDNLFFAPVDYHAGVNAVVVDGNVPFATGDRFTVAVTSVEKVIQKFFRMHFKVQLPSAPAGTLSYYSMLPMVLFTASSAATQADTLAS